MNHSLTLKPLKDALCHSVPEIHHSDQGVQYLSSAYVATLEAHGVEISIARRGRPWENGYAERLIRTLKEEEVDINEYESLTEATDCIGHFITRVYNLKRPHSALGYLTPMEFQRKNLSLTLRNCGPNKRMHFTHAELSKPFQSGDVDTVSVAEPADVSVSIYAVDGQLVRTLDLGHKSVGIYESRSRAVYWDSRNAQGEPVASGVYFYTLTAGNFSPRGKMLRKNNKGDFTTNENLVMLDYCCSFSNIYFKHPRRGFSTVALT